MKHAAVRVSSDLPQLPTARGLPQAERKHRGRQAATELHGSRGRRQWRRRWRRRRWQLRVWAAHPFGTSQAAHPEVPATIKKELHILIVNVARSIDHVDE